MPCKRLKILHLLGIIVAILLYAGYPSCCPTNGITALNDALTEPNIIYYYATGDYINIMLRFLAEVTIAMKLFPVA